MLAQLLTNPNNPIIVVQELFYAEGEGIDASEVQASVDDIRDVTRAMSLPTAQLCSCMDKLLAGQDADPEKELPDAVEDRDTLLCILAHRADHAASKYLKKHFHMPKMDGTGRGQRAAAQQAVAGCLKPQACASLCRGQHERKGAAAEQCA